MIRPSLTPSLALLLALATVSTACTQDSESPAPTRPAGRPLEVPRDANVSRLDKLPKFKAAYEQAYRLAPDARLTLALAELEHLLTQRRPKVEARFQEGQWKLLSDGAEAGSLPEFPDFPQLLALLEARIQQLGTGALKVPSDGSGAEASPLPLGREAVDRLHQLDRDWKAGQRSFSSLRQGARALAALSFQQVDLTEMADAVPARALAHLALARVTTGAPLLEEQVLLAEALGYQRAARELARTLPSSAPIRLYLLEEDEPLEALAQRERKPGLARYLWMRRLADVGRTERARRQERLKGASGLGLHEISAQLRIRDFAHDRTWGTLAPVLILREVASVAGNPAADERAPKLAAKGDAELKRRVESTSQRFNVSQRGILPPFEEQLARVGNADGFFLDARSERAYFQSLFFSAQYRLGLHLLDAYSSAEAASQFSQSLGSGTSPEGQEFQEWLKRLVDAQSGQRVEASLMQGLTEFKSFGAAPVERVFEELEETADWGDPALSTMVRRLASRLDTRPSHRRLLASAARNTLLDLGLSERLYRATSQAMVAPSVEEWLAWLDRDTAKLEALLGSPTLPERVRLRAFEHLLKSRPEGSPDVKEKLAPLLAAHGDEWSFTSECAELLEEYGLYAEARAVVERWMAKHPGSEGFERLLSRTALARLHQRQGNAQAGWEALEPVLSSMQFGVLNRGALLSAELGEQERALKLAQSAAQRYPGPKSLALLAEVLWRTGQHEEAAKALASPNRSLRSTDWSGFIGQRFASFAASHPEQAVSAFTALRKKRIGALELSQLTARVSQKGKAQLAFELQSQVQASGLQQLEMLMRAYGHLAKWKSEQEAMQWLSTRVPKSHLAPLSMFAFAEKADTVLWELIPSPEGQDDLADYPWLMRAAASLRRQSTPNAARAEALRQRFEVDRPGFYHQVGRYLLGLISEQDVIAAATKPKSQEELPFFLGFKAQQEGRYAEAVLWYRATVETSSPRMGEYRWAYNELHRLKQAELSVALLKERSL